jgi:transposase
MGAWTRKWEAGFPLAHEIFAGNVQDRKTVGIMLDRMKTRVGLAPGATVVVDRGMAYADNLQEIRDRGLHYVVAARQPERDQWRSSTSAANTRPTCTNR